MMTFEIALAGFLACLGGLGYTITAIAIRRRRTVCPSCSSLALDTYDAIRATEVDGAGKRLPSSLTKHRCTSCGAAYVRYNGGGLITKQAFEAGARVALPRAMVVRTHT
jgi:hypothetical protein